MPALLVSTVLTFSLNALSPLNPFSITLFTMAPPLIVGWLTLLNAKRQYKKITRESTSRWNALFDAESRFFDKNLSNFNDAEAFDYFANLFTEVNRYKTYKCTRDASVQSLKHRDRAGYYQILGLVPSEKLSKTDIKLAFRAKAHKWHPDRAQDLNEAQMAEWNTKFKRILKAYQVLRNPKKRKVYDKANIL